MNSERLLLPGELFNSLSELRSLTNAAYKKS
jgi:hypothetical protein